VKFDKVKNSRCIRCIMAFTMILAESSLELIPEELASEKGIISYCRRVGRPISGCLLDRSYHHQAMSKLPQSYKRGRPDIAYHVMLDTVYSPLFMDGLMNFYIHTFQDKVIEFGPGVRPPREYSRYEGLMVDLFRKGSITEDGKMLLSIRNCGMKGLLNKIKPALVIGLSILGEPSSVENVARICAATDSAAIVIGGFPHGHFSQGLQEMLDRTFSIASKGLDASLVSARVIYEVERSLGVT